MENKPDAALTSPESHEDVAEGGEQDEEKTTPVVLKKGPWTTVEDAVLMKHVRQHGECNWNAVQRMTGLLRCGKSCRLRWTNHLRPNLKKGSFSPDEELLIAQLHAQLGNKWARMASHLPGRTDNEIKNYWNTRTKRRQRAGLPVYPPEVQLQLALSKRCRYVDFSPLSSPHQKGSNVLSLDAVNAASVGYNSTRPPPLDLAGQLAMANRPMQFRAPTPFSTPSSPWAKPFARNAQSFQFPHSSPVSPTTPTGPVHQVTPELSLGYGLHGGDRTQYPLSRRPRSLEWSSLQANCARRCRFPQPPPPPPQEKHCRIIKTQQASRRCYRSCMTPSRCYGGGGGGEQHVVSGYNNKSEGDLKDDMDTLFDLMIPTTFPTTAPAVPAAAPNHSAGSISQHSSDDQDHSNVDIGMDLPVIGGAGLSEQDWRQLDGACQWNSMSGIC